jgi:hypothetical protein
MEQLTLFEIRDMTKEMDNFKKEWEKTRRSLYARQADLIKKCNALEHEYEIMKLNICKGKIVV